jgi:hypothetical protein
MKSGDHSNERIDRNREGEEKHQTGCKVASESVTDETQAVAYEPRFTTFSGLQDQTLSAQGRGTGVAEFVLEDKQSGKEFTASGERHVPRLSFMEGLRAQLDKARTPAEADQLQSAFSIEYLMRKMKELAASAMSVLTDKPRQGTGKLEQEGQLSQVNVDQTATPGQLPEQSVQSTRSFANPQEFMADLTRRHGVPDATLIANNPSVPSDAIAEGTAKRSQLKPIETREVDFAPSSQFHQALDFGGEALGVRTQRPTFPSPPDVATISWPGEPGKVFNTVGEQSTLFEKRPEDFAIDVFLARKNLVLGDYPNAPPLVCLEVEGSALASAGRAPIASTVAQMTGDYVLGKGKNGEFILFAPSGDSTPTKIDDIHSAEQWAKVREIATSHWAGNRGAFRVPDYHETKKSFTTAPPEVLSLSFHGDYGDPLNMTMAELLKRIETTKEQASQDDHRRLHQPTIIELFACHSGSDSKVQISRKHSSGTSVAAEVARATHSWTVGYPGWVNEEKGNSYKDSLIPHGPDVGAILFDPDGKEVARYPTPVSRGDWQKILKLTEQRR